MSDTMNMTASMPADPAATPLIVVDKLSKKFGDATVLDGVSCDFRQNEITVIIGRSGSGKSTLLRVLAGLTDSDGGTVSLGGEVVSADGERLPGWKNLESQVGMIFQSYTLWSHMTVFENLALAPRRVLRESKKTILERAEQVLAEVGMSEYLHRCPDSLSGGQRQRVAIARALMMKPKILFCDEITSALDPPVAAEVLGVLTRLKRDENLSIALVTHDMAFAARAADRVMFFQNGKITVDATPDEAFLHTENNELRAFVDAVRW